MIHKEAWYRELEKLSDAVQYPTEVTDRDPSLRRRLREVSVTDFSTLPKTLNSWAFVILLTFGSSVQDTLKKMMTEAENAWVEWHSLRQQARHENIDQGRIHDLEKELNDRAYNLHRMYQQALSVRESRPPALDLD